MGLITNDSLYPVATSVYSADEVLMLDGGATLKKVGADDIAQHAASRLGIYNVLDYGAVDVWHSGARHVGQQPHRVEHLPNQPARIDRHRCRRGGHEARLVLRSLHAAGRRVTHRCGRR